MDWTLNAVLIRQVFVRKFICLEISAYGMPNAAFKTANAYKGKILNSPSANPVSKNVATQIKLTIKNYLSVKAGVNNNFICLIPNHIYFTQVRSSLP